MTMEAENDVVMDKAPTEGNLPQRPPAPPTLSKSWAVEAQHIPTFTGGHLTHSKVGLRGDGADSAAALPFLLLPVGGDVAVVDAARGVTLGSLRGQQQASAAGLVSNADYQDEDEEEEEEDSLDVDSITSFALSYSDDIVMTCSQNSIMRQYHLARPTASAPRVAELVRVWGKSGHALPVTHLVFHVSSVFLASGSVDGTVRIWDCRNDRAFLTHLLSRPRHAQAAATIRGSVTALAWYPDHSQLVVAVGRDDGTVVVHNLKQADKTPVAVLADHDAAVTALAWLPAQGLFVTASRDAVLNLWQMSASGAASAYTRIQTLPIYEQIEGLSVAFGRTSTPAIVTAGSKGQVRLWKLEQHAGQRKLALAAEQPSTEAFGDVRGGYLQLVHHQEVHDRAKPGPEQMIVADAEHNLSFLSLSEDSLLETRRTIVGHNDDVLDLKVLPGDRIAVATNSPQVRLFDLQNFSCRVLEGHTATVLSVDVSPCGRYLATCGKDRQVRLWHVEALRCVAIATGHAEAVGSAALSRKQGRYDVVGKAAKNGGGSFMVSASVDRTLKRWNLPGAADLDRAATDQEMISLGAATSVRAHEKDINIVSIAPNDSLVATGSQDKTVKIWKAVDLELVATLKGHRRGVWDCQFSPHDRILATGSGDKSIKLWSLSDFSCVRTFQGHVASVLRVRFMNGGLQMVSSGADGLVKIWTIRTNECETTLDAHNDKAWALDLAKEGTQLVTGAADSKIVVWKDTTVEVEETSRAEQEEAILMDQKLANHLRHKEYKEALQISLQRDKPRHALRVFTAMIEAEVQKGNDGLEPLQLHVTSWDEDTLLRVLQYCRDWNTNTRNCHVALLVIKAIITSIPIHTLAATKGVPEIIAGIMSYAERHFDRLDKLYGNSFLLDFALSSMGDLEASNDEGWEARSKLVLPPKQVDGRIQVGGMAIVGRRGTSGEEDEVLTMGDSDTSDDEDVSPLKAGDSAVTPISEESESSESESA